MNRERLCIHAYRHASQFMAVIDSCNTVASVERAILFEIEAWDVNCPQHIHKRFSQKQVAPVIEQLQGRISELEAEIGQLKGE